MAAGAHALLAVDVVVFSFIERRLCLRVVKIRNGAFAGSWAFPGSLVSAGESLEAVAYRELQASPAAEVHLEQLRTFGDPGRDPRGRIVSTAYLALAPDSEAIGTSKRYLECGWKDARALPRLAYDHNLMAEAAIDRLRSKLGYTNIVRTLLAEEFTLSELQVAYEVILDHPLDRRNFRKKLGATGMLELAGRRRRGPHPPAELYRFRQRRLIAVDIL